MTTKIFVADDVSESGLEPLRAAGFNVEKRPGLKPPELFEALKNCEGLIVRSETKVTAELLDAAKTLRVIGRAGVGVDNIDVPSATIRGVVVMNAPDGNTITTAEHTVAMLVSLDPIYLDFDMSESDFLAYSKYRGHLKGEHVQKVEVALGDDNQYARSGVFDFLDNVLDRSSGTIHARATVANSNLVLTPGLFARVRLIVAPPSPTLLVPDSAVLPDQSQHMVMTVSADGTVAPKRVEVGEIRDGLRVIRSGLAPNDRVILDGLLHAAPGTKVATQDGTIRHDGGQD